ncbi:phosphodiesterase [Idiomarina tyrosinivorans]|uniref:Phosphodiesterase n=1 Tax=Idiomarina tyrosinivorans TaxID=1445662 RepID=A0A432ZJM2_9GAMM|nr:alkaline phosphatase D family protein [Idiomarina tyrosinivorans]RUO78166.1 phosphodiesterase [Idiomarina tyrosinivorans]
MFRTAVVRGVLISAIWFASGWQSAHAQNVFSVAFGCCIDESQRQEVWDALNLADPDVFLFLGDSISVNADDMQDILDGYEVFNRYRGPRVLRRNSAVMSIWNEHDYAIDGHRGNDNPQRYAVRNQFLTFWREPAYSPRQYQQHGIYKSVIFGNAPYRVQVIVLDGRWNRDPLPEKGGITGVANWFTDIKDRFLPNPTGSLLGEPQWQWLAEQLQQPAEVRVIASATPVLAPQNGYDSWAMYSQEQMRLQKLLRETQANGVVLATAGRWFGEIDKASDWLPYPLMQVVSGSVNQQNDNPYAFQQRVGKAQPDARYGQITIDWEQQPAVVEFSLRDINGQPLNTISVPLQQLQAPTSSVDGAAD